MARKSSKNNYLKQAGILAAAGIICRIIGILYRSPLTSIIGDEGNGYYTSAYNIYTIILLLSSYSIPSAVSKIIASKLALKEYRNAHRIFRCALIYVCVIGGAASLFTLFGAELFLEGEAAVVLRYFPQSIFLSGCRCIKRIFSGTWSMIQTSFFTDIRADLKCGHQYFSGKSADRSCDFKEHDGTGNLRSSRKCIRNRQRCCGGTFVYAVCLCDQPEDDLYPYRKRQTPVCGFLWRYLAWNA